MCRPHLNNYTAGNTIGWYLLAFSTRFSVKLGGFYSVPCWPNLMTKAAGDTSFFYLPNGGGLQAYSLLIRLAFLRLHKGQIPARGTAICQRPRDPWNCARSREVRSGGLIKKGTGKYPAGHRFSPVLGGNVSGRGGLLARIDCCHPRQEILNLSGSFFIL